MIPAAKAVADCERRSSRYLSHAPEPSVEPANSETEENVVVAQPKRRQQGQVSTSKSEDHEASVQAETQDEKRRRKIKPKSQGILTQPTIYRHLQQTKATETVNKGLKRKVSALSVDQKDTLNQPHETSKPVKGGKQAKTTKH